MRLEQIAPPGTTIVSGGAVSPAGRHLAFVARDERTGRTALWIRAIDAVDARALPDTEGASHPFFSPDGQMVAFFRNGRLVAADVTGKRQRTIAPVGGAPAGGSWGADDVIVFAEWMTGLFAVASTGGPVSPLTRLDHTALDVAHAWPQFLPDGRRFLYQVVSPDNTRAGVYVSSLDSRTSTRLLDDAVAAIYVAPGFLLYVQHDMLMAEPFDADRLRLGGRAVLLSRGITAPSLAEGSVVSASRDLLAFRAGASKQQLTWVDRSGVPQGSLEVPTSMFNFRVSPDGQFVLAASSLTDATGVWLVDLASRHSTQLAADGIAPLWSPDGRRVAFLRSARPGRPGRARVPAQHPDPAGGVPGLGGRAVADRHPDVGRARVARSMDDETADFTIGVEEEFFVVDAATADLVPRGPELIAAGDGSYSAELHRSLVEDSTDVFTDLGHLRAQRDAARRARRPRGDTTPAPRVGGVGADDRRRQPGRHRRRPVRADARRLPAARPGAGDLRLADPRRVPDRDESIRVMNGSRAWLPVLLALSASSPFFAGTDTGYDSYRVQLWSRWPTAGMPAEFSSWSDYQDVATGLVESGAIADVAML